MSINAEVILLINEFDKFNNKLSEKACYAVENKNENKTAYQITKTNSHWMIDLNATAHYIDNWSIFENLIIRINKLTTADEFLKIMKKMQLLFCLINSLQD